MFGQWSVCFPVEYCDIKNKILPADKSNKFLKYNVDIVSKNKASGCFLFGSPNKYN